MTSALIRATVNVLQRTAIELIQRGWCQNDYELDGNVCLTKAIDYAAPLSPLDRQRTYCALVDTLGERPPAQSDYVTLSLWNDDTQRTEEDVHLLIKTTIARLHGE